MPSKPLTELQKEYKKEYDKYLRRIKSARAAGIDIPERYIKPKKESPRSRDIETLKAITRQKLVGNKTVSVKSETQKAYDKEYKNYLNRVKSARQAGFIIPEESIIPKAEKPTQQAINEIKRINREAFKRKTLTGEVSFVSPETGEFLQNTEAFRAARKRRYRTDDELSTVDLISKQKEAKKLYEDWVFSKDNVTRPTDFQEYIYVVEKIQDYIEKYNPPESSKEFLIDRQIEQWMKTLRGPTFNYDTFKETEQQHGWFFQDPNRPMEQEEINAIQDWYDREHGKTPEGELFKPTMTIPQLVEQLRGWNPEFNYYDKFLDTELEQKENVFNTINEYPEDQFKNYSVRKNDGYYERPKTEQRRYSDTAEEPIEYINVNNLIERLKAIEIGATGKYPRQAAFAQMNKDYLLNFLEGNLNRGNGEALEQALMEHNATGRAFQVWFLYKGDFMAEYMGPLERLLFNRMNYYEAAEEFESGFDFGEEYEE